MMKCTNCGSENKETDVYCYKCGNLLTIPKVVGTTTVLEEETGPVNPRRRWGTARFDTETVLIVAVRDYDSEPIRVRLSHDQTIGRKHNEFTPDVDLTPYDAYARGVSRQHAVVRRQNDTVVIIDMNSANSTFLNGQRLVPDQPRILRDGDEVRLGQLVLRVTFEDELPT